jgi:hypothetical protein
MTRGRIPRSRSAARRRRRPLLPTGSRPPRTSPSGRHPHISREIPATSVPPPPNHVTSQEVGSSSQTGLSSEITPRSRSRRARPHPRPRSRPLGRPQGRTHPPMRRQPPHSSREHAVAPFGRRSTQPPSGRRLVSTLQPSAVACVSTLQADAFAFSTRRPFRARFQVFCRWAPALARLGATDAQGILAHPPALLTSLPLGGAKGGAERWRAYKSEGLAIS